MSATPPVARVLRIHGRVQGVGFRQSLRSEAKSLGVTGWVRNRGDGTVEALVQGDLAPVEALIDWARRGPRGARVDRVDITNSQTSGQENDDFHCHPTI